RLTILGAGRNGKLQRLAVGKRQPALGAGGSLRQIGIRGIGHVRATDAYAGRLAVEQVAKQLVIEKGLIAVEAAIARSPIALGVVLVIGAPRPFGSGTVDLAPVEARALFCIAQ